MFVVMASVIVLFVEALVVVLLLVGALLWLFFLRRPRPVRRSAPPPWPGGGLPYWPSLRLASTKAASVIARAVLTRTKRSR